MRFSVLILVFFIFFNSFQVSRSEPILGAESGRRLLPLVGDKIKVEPLYSGEIRLTRFPYLAPSRWDFFMGSSPAFSRPGKMAQAHRYEISFVSSQGEDISFKFVLPSKKGAVNRSQLAKWTKWISQLPEFLFTKVKIIRINPCQDDKISGLKGEMVGYGRNNNNIVELFPFWCEEGENVVDMSRSVLEVNDIWKAFTETDFKKLLIHELGHTFFLNSFFSRISSRFIHHKIHDRVHKDEVIWRNIVVQDNYFVTSYGTTGPQDDFAETMVLYVISDGGMRTPEILNYFGNRFNFIDKLLGVDSNLKQELIAMQEKSYPLSWNWHGVSYKHYGEEQAIKKQLEGKNENFMKTHKTVFIDQIRQENGCVITVGEEENEEYEKPVPFENLEAMRMKHYHHRHRVFFKDIEELKLHYYMTRLHHYHHP